MGDAHSSRCIFVTPVINSSTTRGRLLPARDSRVDLYPKGSALNASDFARESLVAEITWPFVPINSRSARIEQSYGRQQVSPAATTTAKIITSYYRGIPGTRAKKTGY